MSKDSINSNTGSPPKNVKRYSRREVYLSRIRRKIFKHVYILRVLVVLAFVGALLLGYSALRKVAINTGVSQRIGLAKDFVFPDESTLKSTNGITNILVLGKGGSDHEAPDLTDTIILLTIDLKSKKATQLSLPRDIWIPTLRTKLNSTYYWGNQKEEGGGLVLAKSAVEEIAGVPVHQAVVFDFSLFEEVINILGGVEVDVETGFIDNKFPIKGKENDLCDGDLTYACRFETVQFDVGKQFMDAETALKFVRSRNAEGDEGTDFARSKRQQKVIDAVIAKASSKEFLYSPRKAFAVLNPVLDALETDMTENQMATTGRYLYESRSSIRNISIPEDMLENPPTSPTYDNLYVFIPATGDWNEVHAWLRGEIQ